ncbi:ParB N-terminal domain-containing protein [Herbaspirillum sp. C7C2]|uniref:ParB N-terminal domain-containing protein n=1 Tax=Herbaspirillum sp. C7C2 TaxID=2736666 RepID=UPI001F517AD8|nr:ParB N-terminal domain-containing protein [Herbaspirillum sp. C7C2]MCI1015033.1 ParB N-terminal domain-containing protein [Herbaspirillum sp. C7C2]
MPKKKTAAPADQPQIALIDSGQLRFDPQNPRFYRLEDGTSDSTVIEEMLDDEGVQNLMNSIGHQGYFPGEPLLVAPDENGKYIVVEGNRRLAAVKLLNGELAPPPRKSRSVALLRADAIYQPIELPCIVYPQRADVLRYLGYRHITGIKEWDALSKARYLVELRDTFYADKEPAEQLRILSKEIGSRSDVVAQLLTGLTLFERAIDEKFFKKNNLNPDAIDFSYITTALSYSNIAEWLKLEGRTDIDAANLDYDNLESLFHWMFVPLPGGKTVLRETRRLKQLAAVVNSPDSLRVLVKSGDLDDAYLYTDGPQLALSAALQKADSKLKIVWDMLLSSEPKIEHKLAAEEIALMANRILEQLSSVLSAQDKKKQ